MSQTRPRLTIIGPGLVGSAVARLARRVGYTIAAVAGGSHPDRTAALAETVGAKVLASAEAAAAGDLVLLTVKDAAIQRVCEQLAAAGGLVKTPMIAHCSGALDSAPLAAAKQAGCEVGSMHPLQTFPSVESAIARLPGTYWFLDAKGGILQAMTQLACAMGGHAVPIAAGDKPIYHAAAVLSANYLTTLLDMALELFERVGLEREHARRAVGPLVRATVENVLEQDTAAALSGPIERGDAETVARHLEVLPAEIRDLYCRIGRRTVKLALRKGSIDESTAERIEALLEKQ